MDQVTAKNPEMSDFDVGRLEKFGFHLPVSGFDQRLQFLGNKELELMATKLYQEAPPVQIN